MTAAGVAIWARTYGDSLRRFSTHRGSLSSLRELGDQGNDDTAIISASLSWPVCEAAFSSPEKCRRDVAENTGQTAADQQIAEAIAAELESLSPECRADATRLRRLLAPDFHEFGASGGELGYEGTAERVAAATDPDGEPIAVENMRGRLLADGLVMIKYTSENHGRRSNRTSLWRRAAPGHWQIFHHQGTVTTR